MSLARWLKKTVENLVDPDKDERIENLVRALRHGLSSKKEQFSLSDAIRGLEYKPHDLEIAKSQVYSTILGRGWVDGKLTSDEQKVATWVAEQLEISPPKAREINLEIAREHFLRSLAKTIENGTLNRENETELQAIANSVGFSLPQFGRAFFREEGEAFLRNIFSMCIEDGHISEAEWDSLLSTAKTIGITRQEILDVIQPQAVRFVEHVLVDAKADGILSSQENTALHWMINNLSLPSGFQKYVEQEVAELQTLTNIRDGHLPSLPTPRGIEIRSGEITHYFCNAIWRRVRLLKNGAQHDDHPGVLVFTDNRLIFSSATRSQSISYRKIISHRGGQTMIEVHIEGKPVNEFRLKEPSPIPYALFSAAVAMANQTKVGSFQGTPTRHIPREIRQRVWQRYGGRCTECGAHDYLEFDHIIPVAKGGSHSDSNVQLLCRRCNLKKSDTI